jgi:hypothetical protein
MSILHSECVSYQKPECHIQQFQIRMQTCLWQWENYLDTINLNAYTGLFLFTSVYKLHNSTSSQWQAALSGPQHTPNNLMVIKLDDYEIQSDMDGCNTGKPLES